MYLSFGHLLAQKRQSASSSSGSLRGVELSPGMSSFRQGSSSYTQIHQGPIEEVLSHMGAFDHIVTFFSLYHLAPEVFSMVMARSFQLAQKSIAVAVLVHLFLHAVHALCVSLPCNLGPHDTRPLTSISQNIDSKECQKQWEFTIGTNIRPPST